MKTLSADRTDGSLSAVKLLLRKNSNDEQKKKKGLSVQLVELERLCPLCTVLLTSVWAPSSRHRLVAILKKHLFCPDTCANKGFHHM